MYTLVLIQDPFIASYIFKYDQRKVQSNAIYKSVIYQENRCLLDLLNTVDGQLFLSKFHTTSNINHARMSRQDITKVPFCQFNIFPREIRDRVCSKRPKADEIADLCTLRGVYIDHHFEEPCATTRKTAFASADHTTLKNLWFNEGGFQTFFQ